LTLLLVPCHTCHVLPSTPAAAAGPIALLASLLHTCPATPACVAATPAAAAGPIAPLSIELEFKKVQEAYSAAQQAHTVVQTY
jgi:hypothetical protein